MYVCGVFLLFCSMCLCLVFVCVGRCVFVCESMCVVCVIMCVVCVCECVLYVCGVSCV